MDCPSDLFQQQPSQVCHFDLYHSPSESTSTGPLVSPLLHPNSASQRWGGYRQGQCLFSDMPTQEEEQEVDADRFGRKSATGGTPIPQYRIGDRRRGSGDWSQDLLRVKQLRVDSSVKREAEAERDGHRGRRSVAQLESAEKSAEERGRRKKSREGRQRQRRELKLQLEETRGKLLELQRKVWQVYGEHHVEEEKGGEGDDGVMDETAEMFSEGETDDHLSSGLYPPLGVNEKKHESTGSQNSELFHEPPVDLDLDMELDGGGVWLGCSLVHGEWENVGGSEKFAQALKQELSSAVARVIDRVLHLYAETNQTPPSSAMLSQEIPTSRAIDPDKKHRPGMAVNMTEQAEALPLVAKRAQEKRHPLIQGRQKNLLMPQANSSLPLLPQPHLSALLPPRSKDSFLQSCPPNPPPLPLPLLHYTMQHLFTRSLSSMPLHKDGLHNEPFMDFRSHNPSFPPLPLLGQLNPPLGDRGRDEGMRVGIDGGDSALYLGPGASQEGLSPCHLKKAKLMFFYTRYPSSNTLKTYFPDVKFNRCVTSQLIKWFSNFREFFYIQMERFARQAAREGPVTARERGLRLSRNSELFRILNMHYNKSNDYQVPDRFVEVSEVALREFFTAIQSGRDTDPCWKKSIYKIICKLDSPVPDSFRLPGCPMDTHRMV
ncbi:prospero homeobox 3 [Tachysurus fulvidraco]|uniref:prospero homeobox 3 n=1 Tax=Tachysurus fulvidraco TaxID=1234273 RepID=UPI000F4D6EB4|nr:prospero homeobox 3 [Tachysurus fulvidraco]